MALPPPLQGLAHAAEPLQTALAVHAINHLLRGQRLRTDLDHLDGKRLWVCVTDLDGCVRLRIDLDAHLADVLGPRLGPRVNDLLRRAPLPRALRRLLVPG